VDIQTSEVDMRLEPVHGTMKFCMLIDIERMYNFYQDNFCEEPKKYECGGWLTFKIQFFVLWRQLMKH
jgi:hypothetical protein